MFLKTDSSNHKQWAEEDFTHSLVGNGLGGGGGTACFQSSRPEKTLNGLIVQMQKKHPPDLPFPPYPGRMGQEKVEALFVL